MENTIKFIGRGWSFPPEFNQLEENQVKMVSGREDIEQSIAILLKTIRGERVMIPEYGSNMDEMIFETFDQSIKTYLQDSISKAILYHEPRVEPLHVNVNDVNIYEGLILIEIEYRIRTTNSRFNMVYPFYIKEGTEI